MSFMISKLVFIDSLQFMDRGLSYFANILPKKKNFYHTENEFGSDALDLITKKGVCPYDYMDDFDKFGKDEI